jgi:hypothetical protein
MVFRSFHNSVIQSIQRLHDRGKHILYTSTQKSTELVFLKNKFVVLVYVYFQYPVHIYLAVFIGV